MFSYQALLGHMGFSQDCVWIDRAGLLFLKGVHSLMIRRRSTFWTSFIGPVQFWTVCGGYISDIILDNFGIHPEVKTSFFLVRISHGCPRSSVYVISGLVFLAAFSRYWFLPRYRRDGTSVPQSTG